MKNKWIKKEDNNLEFDIHKIKLEIKYRKRDCVVCKKKIGWEDFELLDNVWKRNQFVHKKCEEKIIYEN